MMNLVGQHGHLQSLVTANWITTHRILNYLRRESVTLVGTGLIRDPNSDKLEFNLVSRYRMDAGEFESIRLNSDFDLSDGTWGAFEVSARYATLDLNDSDILGGEEDSLSLALNWYPNRNLRIMADWTRILDTDESNTIRMFAPDMNVFMLRTQWNF